MSDQRIQPVNKSTASKKSVNDRLSKIINGQPTAAKPEHRQSKKRPEDVRRLLLKNSVLGKISKSDIGKATEKPVNGQSKMGPEDFISDPLAAMRIASKENLQNFEREIRQKKLALSLSIIEEQKQQLLKSLYEDHGYVLGKKSAPVNITENADEIRDYPVPPPPSPVGFMPSPSPFNFDPSLSPPTFEPSPSPPFSAPVQIVPMVNQMEMMAVNCLIQLAPDQQEYLLKVATFIGSNLLKTRFDVFINYYEHLDIPLNIDAAAHYLKIREAMRLSKNEGFEAPCHFAP